MRPTVPHAPLQVGLARSPADLAACQSLRHVAFFGRPGIDADGFDAGCLHLMIADAQGLAGTCRVALLPPGSDLQLTYTGQAYDLTPLAPHTAPMLEVGRFCTAPGAAIADVLRLAWGALAALVDVHGVGLMIGCSSFRGADPVGHRAALALLGAAHQGPAALRPGRRAVLTVPLTGAVPDRRAALAGLPPLLRSYLGLGGWVGDHAVIDRRMDTLHVFTALPVADVPPARARALRALAQTVTPLSRDGLSLAPVAHGA
ncbi:ornithine-acyl[acyl carrier protein] N-acyltransferase [Loktanella fryxellensis]|uniref:L-ornithine N(alpha)-acyltransferase n=1 Tax=Loktanella fryxellensis TaxID=245187 RepID=A0A1H7Y8C3_9RHOB|nr:GNAT family N-acetyltransferase [Loktanella fryxellensis]SEM42466.1 ornithine-acyl[acyl carrier protein] N-acyltransferase [Loktanella fryxellensis]